MTRSCASTSLAPTTPSARSAAFQRSWVYASAKGQNNYFSFGTVNDLELSANHLIIKQSTFPLPESHDKSHSLPCAKIIGSSHNRPKAFRPSSVVNVSGMSFGNLSGPAIEALNKVSLG